MGLEINGLNTSQTTTKQTKGGQQVADSKDDKAKRADISNGEKTTVSISEEAKSLNQLQGEVSKGESFNENKVAELKAAIADGSYKPNADSIAGKLLDIDSQF